MHQVRGWYSGVELKMSRRQGAGGSVSESILDRRATQKIGQIVIGLADWLEKGSSASLLVRYAPRQFDGRRVGETGRHKRKLVRDAPHSRLESKPF